MIRLEATEQDRRDSSGTRRLIPYLHAAQVER